LIAHPIVSPTNAIPEKDFMTTTKITDKQRLEWLIRRSDPVELFGSDFPTWNTEEQFFMIWRAAINQAIKEEGYD
jgi:hypothetical protein